MSKQSQSETKRTSPAQTSVPNQFEGMLGVSLPMLEVFQSIIDAASADVPVLITGETGTGKDLVAGAIHNRSRRESDKETLSLLVQLDCCLLRNWKLREFKPSRHSPSRPASRVNSRAKKSRSHPRLARKLLR